MVKRLALALLACVLVALLPGAAAAAASQVNLIVGVQPGVGSAERVEIRRDADVRFDQRLLLPRAELVSVDSAAAAQALRDLRSDPDVEFAERDRVIRASATTNTSRASGRLTRATRLPTFAPCRRGRGRSVRALSSPS